MTMPCPNRTIATVAAVVLLFNVGLETDLKLLLRYSVAGGLVGLAPAPIAMKVSNPIG